LIGAVGLFLNLATFDLLFWQELHEFYHAILLKISCEASQKLKIFRFGILPGFCGFEILKALTVRSLRAKLA
jgi:hypothetical protein